MVDKELNKRFQFIGQNLLKKGISNLKKEKVNSTIVFYIFKLV